jgi:hypothetical protein
MQFFIVCHFLGVLKLQMQHPTLPLNKALFNNHMRYSFISTDSTVSATSGRSPHQQQ